MSPENFVYWLNGFVELTGEKPSDEQWKSIKDHLSLVMTKITPVRLDLGDKPLDLSKFFPKDGKGINTPITDEPKLGTFVC